MFRSKQQKKTQDNGVRSFDRYNKNLIKCETTHKIEILLAWQKAARVWQDILGQNSGQIITNWNLTWIATPEIPV